MTDPIQLHNIEAALENGGEILAEPPTLEPTTAAYEAVAERASRAITDARDCHYRLRQLRGTRSAVDSDDLAASVAALRSGDDDPGPVNRRKLDAEIAEAERNLVVRYQLARTLTQEARGAHSAELQLRAAVDAVGQALAQLREAVAQRDGAVRRLADRYGHDADLPAPKDLARHINAIGADAQRYDQPASAPSAA